MVARPPGLFWLCLAAFLALLGSVLAGWADLPDRYVLVWLSTLATPFLTRFAIAVSILGSGWAITPLALGAFLALRRRSPPRARWLLMAVGGGLLLFLALAFLIGRPRPTFFPSPVSEPTASFPSGHALNTTVVFAALYLVLNPVRRVWRKGLAVIGVLTVALVSASRLYLQIHYPSDIVAGIVFGLAWVLALHTFWPPVDPVLARSGP